MLLACAGIASNEAVESLLHVMHLGAVPDTWAPDGSSVRPCRSPSSSSSAPRYHDHGLQLQSPV